MSYSWFVGACDLSCVAALRAEVLLSFFFPKSDNDVIGSDHKVSREAHGAALSTVEEDVGGDGRDGSSQELKPRISRVPLDQGEEVLGGGDVDGGDA